MKCIGIILLGLYVFIIVLVLGRFIDEEKDIVDYFVKYFGESVY